MGLSATLLSFLKALWTDIGIYCVLFVLTLFINKYVLSVLGFTYPTVYQGWQTFVGAFILLYLKPRLISPEDGYKLTCQHFLHILPSLIVHAASIIASSKSLSAIPIPLFLCAHNVISLCVLMITVKHVSFSDFVFGMTGLCAAILLFIAGGHLITLDSLVWTAFFVTVSTISELIEPNLNTDADELNKLYFKNTFSFLILTPCSLYLGEAFTALNFKYLLQVEFFAGCFLSGICGILLQIYGRPRFSPKMTHYLSAVVKIPAILLSIALFDSSHIAFSSLWILIFINVLSTVIFTDSLRTEIESKLPKVNHDQLPVV